MAKLDPDKPHPNDPIIAQVLEEVSQPGFKPIRSEMVGNTAVDLLADVTLPKPTHKTGFKEKIIVYRTVETSAFDPILFEQCCQFMESGGSLYKFCKDRGLDRASFWKTVRIDEDTRQRFLQAQEAQGQDYIQEAGRVARKLVTPERLVECVPDGREKLGNAIVNGMVQGARLFVDVAKRLAPHLYGDRIEVNRNEHSLSYVVQFNPEQAEAEQRKREKEVFDVEPGALMSPKRQGKTKEKLSKKAACPT